MTNHYFRCLHWLIPVFFLWSTGFSQPCVSLTSQITAIESRCAATGSVKVQASGGSGNYIYKATGPVNTVFTTVDSITGLAAGIYTIFVSDLVNNCTTAFPNILVPGSYQDPRYTLFGEDVSCENGNNGSISVLTQEFGRAPFLYSIVAPSSSGVGRTSSSGVFNNLPAGSYSIRLTDSCGGIQTRLVVINNYTWRIDAYSFTKVSCDSISGFIRVLDSRGNNSQVDDIPGMLYGIVRQPGDTLWSTGSTFTFSAGSVNSFKIVVKDKCGNVKSGASNVSFYPTVGATVLTSNFTCSTFTAAITGSVNFFNPAYCLYDNSGNQMLCNSTGVFNNLPYGRYCIQAHDDCTDTIITRCFTAAAPVIRIGSTITITNKTCTSFSAAVNGAIGLTNATYCLKDSLGNTIACNATGIFNNLSYGYYCITVRDGCRDTTLIRCFRPFPPRPTLPSILLPVYATCSVFGLVVTGDSLSNPRFCLFDSLNQVVSCNNTGVFDSIPLGRYCINMYDSCYDTTIIRCLNVNSPIVNNDFTTTITNRTCSTFTVTIRSSSISTTEYCLYNNQNSLVSCNTNGIFTNLPNGTYCIKSHGICPDSIFTNCFTVVAPAPSIGNTISISSRTCSTFTASAKSFSNLTNPTFCLYDSANVQILCNATGRFTGLRYGTYCITMRDGCYDTVIRRCFTVAPLPVVLSVTAKKSCTYGLAQLTVSVSGGSNPMTIRVFNSRDSLIATGTYSGNSITFSNLPGTNGTEQYLIKVIDLCGAVDSVKISAVASSFSHYARADLKCPSATWQTGSGNIVASAVTNMGTLTVRIIKKDASLLTTSISPTNVSAGVYNFNNLGPGVYVIRYQINDNCNNTQYDTVTIAPYQFPMLNRSSAFQCDQNGFSVGAAVSFGVAPFQYEIIGSTPSSPSIISSPQQNPVFNINNGTNYSLVRLRVIDACGNASLEDASILPFANNGITATFNCLQLGTILRADSFNNASFSWYKKPFPASNDSTFLGSNSTYAIPQVMPQDTGWYVVHLSVNNGCIRRTSQFNLNGACANILPVRLLDFSGESIPGAVQLRWKLSFANDLNEILVEKRNESGYFLPIGRVAAQYGGHNAEAYNFLDTYLESNRNTYRLKFVYKDRTFSFSNILSFSASTNMGRFNIFPNPVKESCNIVWNGVENRLYLIQLMDLSGRILYSKKVDFKVRNAVQISRGVVPCKGLYLLKLVDSQTQQSQMGRVIFE